MPNYKCLLESGNYSVYVMSAFTTNEKEDFKKPRMFLLTNVVVAMLERRIKYGHRKYRLLQPKRDS